MRSDRIVVMLTVLALLAPVASAAPTARIDIDGPTEVVALDARDMRAIPLTVHLALRDFACSNDAWYHVQLEVSAPNGIEATLDATELSYLVPAGTYRYADPYRGEQRATLSLRGTGEAPTEVNVIATFLDTERPCMSNGDIPASGSSVRIAVDPARPTTPPDGEDPDGPDSPYVDGRVPPGSGPIGGYRPGLPGAVRNIPALGVVGLVGVFALALVLRRKR